MASLLPNSCKELFSYIKRIVSESLTLVRDVNVTENNAIDEELTVPQVFIEDLVNKSTTIVRKKALTKSAVVGQLFDHTFAISEDSIVSKLSDSEGRINCVRHFTLNTRLKGWNIERRQRAYTKMCDMFYYHSRSNRIFRSIVEVLNFIMYEIYPTTQRKSKDDVIKAESSTRKRKKKSTANETKVLKISKMTTEDVENFMADAFRIFQDNAYGEESEMEQDFKYSDHFIFSRKGNNFDSSSKEDQETQKASDTEIDAVANEQQRTIKAGGCSREINENPDATQSGGQEIQPKQAIEEFLPHNIINEIIKEDKEITQDWNGSPSKVISKVFEEWIYVTDT